MSWLTKLFTPRKRAAADGPDAADADITTSAGKRLRAAAPVDEPAEVVPLAADSGGLLASALVPRPLALVSLLSDAGELVISPATACSFVSNSPPLLSLALGKPAFEAAGFALAEDGVALTTPAFVVSLLTEDIAEAALACVGRHPLPEGTTELELKSSLTTAASTKVAVPRIAQAALSLECRPFQTLSIGESASPTASFVLLAEVLGVAARGSLLTTSAADQQTLDAAKLRPVAWLGNGQASGLTAPLALRLPALPQAPAPPLTPRTPMEQEQPQPDELAATPMVVEAAQPLAEDKPTAAQLPAGEAPAVLPVSA